MRLELTGRKVAISPGLRRVVDQKLGKLLRHLNDSGISAAVVVSKEKVNNVVELSLHARGERYLNAVGKATTWEHAVSDAVEKVLGQVEKAKGRWQERRKREAGLGTSDGPPDREAAGGRKPGFIDSCHALASDSEVVRTQFPQFYEARK